MEATCVRPFGMKYVINKPRNGIELHFPGKPDESILDRIRDEQIWKYNGKKRAWYTTYTDEALDFANRLMSVIDPVENNLPCGVKIGDVFVSEFGYEQTNVLFYQVVETKGNATVILKEIAKKFTHGFNAGEVMPDLNNFIYEKTVMKRVNTKCGYPVVNINGSNAALHVDGKRYSCSWEC